MKIPRRTIFFCLTLWLAGLTAAIAALALCPACGRESREGDLVCRFCLKPLPGSEGKFPSGKSLPRPEEGQADAKPTVEAETTTAPLELKFAQADAADARMFLDKKEPRLASLMARNALALHELSREKNIEMVQAMKALIRQAESTMLIHPVSCPICKGSGTRLDLVMNMKGEAKKVQGPNLACLGCKAKKQIPGLRTVEDFSEGLAKAANEFAAIQEAKGYQKLQEAWIPSSLDPAILPVSSISRLRQATVGPCSSCLGFGKTSCESCEGLGLLACDDSDCVSGKVVCPDCKGKKMEPVQIGAQTAMRTCRTCSGRGIASCETCVGQGFLTCAKCEGAKSITCRDCKSTGEPELCSRCKGKGTADCTRCKGTGESKGKPCEACRGEKSILCQSCQGYGRSTRNR